MVLLSGRPLVRIQFGVPKSPDQVGLGFFLFGFRFRLRQIHFGAVGAVELRVILNGLLGAGRLTGDAEITHTVGCLAIAGGAEAGLLHITGLGAGYGNGAGVLILDAAGEQVG